MPVKKYAIKQMVIEAIQCTGYNINEIESFTNHEITIHPFNVYTFKKSNGYIEYFSIGDYIIKGENGEFYSCRQDIFENTFEQIKAVFKTRKVAKK